MLVTSGYSALLRAKTLGLATEHKLGKLGELVSREWLVPRELGHYRRGR